MVSLDHNLLARQETPLHYHFVACLRPELYESAFDDIVIAEDEDVRPVLLYLYSLCRDDNSILPDIQQQGYPVVITYPEDGVSYGIEATGVIKGGKNNAEAKKFVDWAASKKFAEFIVANKINYVPTRNDVKTDNPILDLTKIKMIPTDVTWKGEKRKEYTQRWINEVIK